MKLLIDIDEEILDKAIKDSANLFGAVADVIETVAWGEEVLETESEDKE